MVCATSKGSDQHAHTHSLIRAFATCLNILRTFIRLSIWSSSHRTLDCRVSTRLLLAVTSFCILSATFTAAQRNTVKPVSSGHSKRRPKLVFKTDDCLMQVKSIAECSKGSILKYFRPSLSYIFCH